MPINKTFAIPFIDNARGLASLLVVLYHYFGILDNHFLDHTIFENIARFGGSGVYIFFIISGFILPYSLYNGHYRLKNYGQFLLKRIIRLDPPYLLSIVFVIAVSYALGLFSGVYPHYTFKQLGLHLAYLNAFFGEEWVNIVYWTLAIEFNYYLILGLVFPLLTYHLLSRTAVIGVFWFLPAFVPYQHDFLISYTHYFAVGMLGCLYYVKQLSKTELYVWPLVILASALLQWVTIESMVVIGITILLFAMLNFQNRYLSFLGLISYSLYLTHTYTGLILISWTSKRTDSLWVELAVGVLAIAVAIGFSYIFYQLIEKYSKEWSKSIRYQNT
jgi:peptidoglycan/LPS O-acetylase OafA/YrhL